jgi:endonuclease/exonuclease/phosphatase family metal-dependent hydrolase
MKLIFKQQVLAPTDLANMRIMSYNIRMAPFSEDDATENAWRYRLPKINMIFDHYQPDIIGIQEVSVYQMGTLEQNCYTIPYKFLGKYPTKPPVECGLGIIYNSQKFLLISDLKTRWLNETQKSAAGPVWDGSAYERYVIYAKFRSRVTEREFWFMTTHFDVLGVKAREESAKIVIDLAASLDVPAILTGDFNCFPQLGGQALYDLLNSRSCVIKDSATRTQKIFGVPGSWIGWEYDLYKQREGYAKYDFIFVHDKFKVFQQGIIDDRVWDDQLQRELYPSDHRPVLSDVVLT